MKRIYTTLLCLCLTACGWGGPHYATNYAKPDRINPNYYETVNYALWLDVVDVGVPGVKCRIGFLERYSRSSYLIDTVPQTMIVDSGRCTGFVVVR